MYNDEYLVHYGVMGMKWGNRRTKFARGVDRQIGAVKKSNSEFNTKVAKIQGNKKQMRKGPSFDREMMEYRNQPLNRRLAKTAGSVATKAVIADLLSGKAKNYKSMSKEEVANKMAKLALATAAEFAKREISSRAVAQKYNADGTKKAKYAKEKYMAREEKAVMAYGVATNAAKAAKLIMGMEMTMRMNKQYKADERVKQWGANILSEKLDHRTFVQADWKVQ